jgi:hypothetical protein
LAGTVSGPDSGTGRNRLALLAGGAAVVIVLAFVIFFLSRGGREDAAPPPPAGGNVGGGPMTVEEIRTQSPALNPARTINRARDVAGATDRRNDELKEIGKEYTEE